MEELLGGKENKELIRKFPNKLKQKIIEAVEQQEKRVNREFFLPHVYKKEERIKKVTEGTHHSKNVYIEKEIYQKEGEKYYDLFSLLVKWEIKIINGNEFIDKYVNVLKKIYESPYLKVGYRYEYSKEIFSLHAFQQSIIHGFEDDNLLFEGEQNQEELLMYLKKEMKKWYVQDPNLAVIMKNKEQQLYSDCYVYLMNDEEWKKFIQSFEKEVKEGLEKYKQQDIEEGFSDMLYLTELAKKIERLKKRREGF